MKTTPCPHCGGELNVGQVLGRLNSGPRRHTPENKARLTLRLVAARAKLAEKREREKREEVVMTAEQLKAHWLGLTR